MQIYKPNEDAEVCRCAACAPFFIHSPYGRGRLPRSLSLSLSSAPFHNTFFFACFVVLRCLQRPGVICISLLLRAPSKIVHVHMHWLDTHTHTHTHTDTQVSSAHFARGVHSKLYVYDAEPSITILSKLFAFRSKRVMHCKSSASNWCSFLSSWNGMRVESEKRLGIYRFVHVQTLAAVQRSHTYIACARPICRRARSLARREIEVVCSQYKSKRRPVNNFFYSCVLHTMPSRKIASTKSDEEKKNSEKLSKRWKSGAHKMNDQAKWWQWIGMDMGGREWGMRAFRTDNRIWTVE